MRNAECVWYVGVCIIAVEHGGCGLSYTQKSVR